MLQNKLHSASRHEGPWPNISVWHGTADRTIDIANSQAIIDQWRGVHRVDDPASDLIKGHEHLVWKDESGRDAIEFYRIAGMGHGTPLNVESGYGSSGAYMLNVGISSTEVMA